MTKKGILCGVLFLYIFSIATPAYCDNALKKLGRGVCNVVTCPFELPEQIQRTNNSDGPMAGLTVGILKGVAMIGVRAIVGAYEIATFPIPLPKHYGPVLKDPEFFFSDMNW